MRRKLEELRDIVRGLIDQREHLLLIVSSADTEVLYALKALEGLDQTSPSDVVLLFADPCHDASRYVSAIVRRLRIQVAEVQAQRAERGETPWPALPEVCDDDAVPPHQRLRAAVDHVSSLMPAGDHRVIWAFLPTRIDDRDGYARLLVQFVPWNGPEPWMKGLRVVARDDRDDPFLHPGLRKRRAPGVLLYCPDLSPPALTDALARDAADRSLPVAERMEALAQLAALDHAHRRHAQAIEKYGMLYNYYGEHRLPGMQAVVLQGVGDILRQRGDLEGARDKYQQGIALLSEPSSLPILLNLTAAAGDVSLELRDHATAEGFFGIAQQIAGKLLNPYAKGDVLEKQGIARARAGDHASAVLVWKDAAALCETYGYHERRRAVLERLITAYKRAGLTAERRACEEELDSVRQAMKEEQP